MTYSGRSGAEYRKYLHGEAVWIGKSDALQKKGVIQGWKVVQFGSWRLSRVRKGSLARVIRARIRRASIP